MGYVLQIIILQHCWRNAGFKWPADGLWWLQAMLSETIEDLGHLLSSFDHVYNLTKFKISVTTISYSGVHWNLPYLDLYYPGSSVVWTARISLVACSPLTVMKYELDESSRKGPKGCCVPVWWYLRSYHNWAIGNSGNGNWKRKPEMENGNGQNLMQMNAMVKPLINDHLL